MSTRLASLALAAGAAVVAAGCSRADGEKSDPGRAAFGLTAAQRARIHVAPAASDTFSPTVEVTGTVAFDGNTSTQVLAPISGPVVRLLVELGDHVTGGQAIALVSSPDFAADVAAYRKALAAAVNARHIADLDEQLWKNDAIARRDLEQAQTDAAQAEADRDAALEQLRAIGVDTASIGAIQEGRDRPGPAGRGARADRRRGGRAAHHAGTAPAGGHDARASPSPTSRRCGSWRTSSSRTCRTSRSAIRPRSSRPWETRRSPGTVNFVGALVDPQTRATAVRVVARNRNDFLKRDMYVRVAIHSRHPRRGLLVPVSAVLRDAENLPFVFLAAPDSSFARRPVTLGSRVGDRFEIAAGLAAGDHIIVEGGLFLQFAESQ